MVPSPGALDSSLITDSPATTTPKPRLRDSIPDPTGGDGFHFTEPNDPAKLVKTLDIAEFTDIANYKIGPGSVNPEKTT